MSRTGHENHEFHVVTPRYLRLDVVLPTFTTNSSMKMIQEKSKISWRIFYVFDKMTARLPRHTRPYILSISLISPPCFFTSFLVVSTTRNLVVTKRNLVVNSFILAPLIFNLVPRGEHHEESRGAKEEPRHDFFFQLSDGPPDL